ncbi:MAG: hypothetical protein KBT06_05120, partial [Prevotellaceae bacterium]|nr:hypothetical protein [Candidatus Colivivens equi]
MSDQAFAIFQVTYSLVMTSAVGCIAAFLKSHFSANKNSKQADMLLLRLALINIHDESMAQGYITRYSFKTFNEIWELYHTGYKGNTLTDK